MVAALEAVADELDSQQDYHLGFAVHEQALVVLAKFIGEWPDNDDGSQR